MAYRLPITTLTATKHGQLPAKCPACGTSQVTLYVATDVAQCDACERAWHPSDRFYADMRLVQTDRTKQT